MQKGQGKEQAAIALKTPAQVHNATHSHVWNADSPQQKGPHCPMAGVPGDS